MGLGVFTCKKCGAALVARSVNGYCTPCWKSHFQAPEKPQAEPALPPVPAPASFDSQTWKSLVLTFFPVCLRERGGDEISAMESAMRCADVLLDNLNKRSNP